MSKFFILYLIDLLNKYLISIKVTKNYIKLNINFNNLIFIINFLKFHYYLRFNLLIDIVCIDYLKKFKRFELNYILLSMEYNSRIIVSINLDSNDILSSLNSIFLGSNWFEREIYDLYGIYFSNHKDLRRILTDYGFEGFPFRKDFPLNGYLEVRYDEEKQYLIYEPLELMQNIRIFNFINPSLKKYLI